MFLEERNGSYNTPFKFNAKELDEETGLYYYGAKYYNPKTSLWLSVDPLAEKYPNMSPYAYVANNPVNAIDPDGRVIIFINGMHTGDGGNSKYWEKTDQYIADKFQDYKARYYDGSSGGHWNTILGLLSPLPGSFLNRSNVNPKYRMNQGFKKGYSEATEIYANLSDGETIKIASHSMGGAYDKGFIKGLKKYAKENKLKHRIERVLNLANFQGSSQNIDPDIPIREQISHKDDSVAGTSKVKGMRNSYETSGEHGVATFQKDIHILRDGNSNTAQPSSSKKVETVHQERN